MEIAVRSLLLLVLICTFTITLLDINRNQTIKQLAFESVRAANQNGLIEISDEYNDFEPISTGEMLNEWLISFVNNNSLNYKDLTIGFVEIRNDPPLYIVTLEGYVDNYILVTKDAYIEYTNAAMIVSENDNE